MRANVSLSFYNNYCMKFAGNPHHRLQQTPTPPYAYGFILVITNIFYALFPQIILVNILGLVSQDLPTLNTTNYNTKSIAAGFSPTNSA